METKYLCLFILLWTSSQALQAHEQSSAVALPVAADVLLGTQLPTQQNDDYDEDYDRMDEEYDERYARDFPYNQPMGPYKTVNPTASSRQGRAHVRFVHRTAKPRMYAKKYRTWAPSKEFLHPKYRPPKKLPPPQKRRPGQRGDKGPPNKRRKMPPTRGNHLRKPKPPRDSDYDYEQDYYPEESKRNEYTYDSKKRGNKKPRRPPSNINNLYDNGEESVSYMNFVQQPHGSDYNEFEEDDRPRRPEKKRKKKRKKGERTRDGNREGDQFGATSEPVEDRQRYERFPPYPEEDPPLRRPVRRPAPSPLVPLQTTPLYGDGYIGHQANRPAPQNVNIFGSNRGGLSQYQNNPNFVGAQSFHNPPNDDFQGSAQAPNNFNDYDSVPQDQAQNFNPYTNQNYRNPAQSFPPQIPNQQLNNPLPQTFSRPAPSAFPKPAAAFPSRGNEYSSKYKSSSFFDNTDTFQNFNQNADYPQNTGNRNKFVPSAEYQDQNSETDFINRHLDLYSNGMSGVPVQGDGRQTTRTKDYDIGYGEIHYDESHLATK